MQKVVFILMFFQLGFKAFSQENFFVYFQAENHEPFYAKINAKFYSSSETGYIIVSKLNDGVQEVVIGFAKNEYPEQYFSLAVNKKDNGFLLKNFVDKGWVLVNLQNSSVINNIGHASGLSSSFSGTRKTDAFSQLLANVVNDTAILYSIARDKVADVVVSKATEINQSQTVEVPEQNIVLTNPVLPPAIKEVERKKDSIVTGQDDIVPKSINEIPKFNEKLLIDPIRTSVIDTNNDGSVKPQSTFEKPFITKIDERKMGESYQATFIEQYNFATDTIKIFISANESPIDSSTLTTKSDEKKGEQLPEQNKIVIENTPLAKPVVVDSATFKAHAIEINNSDCKNFATDYDVDKLRVKLINDKTIDDKIASAKKYFRGKCFSVKQIKALTELFPSDETKFRFFEIAYPFVSDTGNFYIMEESLEKDFYKNRFKAMILK